MFIERAEVGQPGDFDRMSDAALRALIKQKLERLGLSDKLKEGAPN